MFGKLLVALDGSRLAEYALGPAFELAAKFGSHVLLLRVIAGEQTGAAPSDPNDTLFPDRFCRREAEDYLREIQARYRESGLTVQAQVETGGPADAITRLADSWDVDLIVMSTHGRSGIMRLLYGSVAEAVLRGAHTPLLLVPITGRPAIL